MTRNSSRMSMVLEHAKRHALALGIVALATWLNLALQPWMAGRAPFLPYFPALVLIGLYAGLWPAVLSLVMVIGMATYLWMPPFGWAVERDSDLATVALFAASAAMVIAVSVRARSLIAAHRQARAAQEAMRESEERLWLALEGAQIGMWSTDLRTGLTQCSDINLALFGLPAGADSPLPSDVFQRMILREDRKTVTTLWAEASRLRQAYSIEYRIRRADGAVRWIYSRGRFHVNMDGSVRRLVGISMDVTDRKEAEQARVAAESALRQTKEEFENVFRIAPVGIVLARDRECRTVTGNAYAERLFEVPSGANVSASAPVAERLEYTILRDGQPVAADDLPLQKAARLGQPFVDDVLQLVLPGSRPLEVVVSAVPLLDESGEPRGAIGTLQDLSTLRRMEAALHVSEERFRVAQDSSLVAFAILRAVRHPLQPSEIVDFEFEYANRAAAKILRRPMSELVGRRLLLALPGHRTASPLFETYVRVLDSGVAETVQLAYEADGIRATFLTAVSRLGDAVAVWFLDLTERQALIEELRATEASLREADRQKDEFLATLAHELRNPMAPIRYAAAMIRNDAPTGTLERARQMIERQSAQMSRLLDDLLDMSRITRNVIELKRELVDLRQVVEEVVDSARPGAIAERHSLGVALPTDPVYVDGDPVRLGQVVHNLLQNATKYTPAGGRIDVSVAARDGKAGVSVRDTGVGLAPEMLQSVFKLFAQVHTAAHESKGGLGIGLAISRRLVELHGGSIEARSAGLGCGAEFRVTLPLSQAIVAASDDGPSGARSLSRHSATPMRRRVLIVDDNADAADGLAMLLRAHGIDVHVVYRGADALTVADLVTPDIVLLDLGLPDLPGEEVARRLRQLPWAVRARFIAITGWGQEADRARTKAAGFDLHLVKPVDPDVLLGVIGETADAVRAG